MPTCEHGPNDTPGCDQQDLVWLKGKWYSPHFEPSHWSRLKKGTAKPKTSELGLPGNATEDEVHEALKKLNEELKQTGKLG